MSDEKNGPITPLEKGLDGATALKPQPQQRSGNESPLGSNSGSTSDGDKKG